jgi:myosin-5
VTGALRSNISGYCFAGCLARNVLEVKRQVAAAVSVEKYARRWFCRCAYWHLRSAAIVIQSGVRYMLAVQSLLNLKKDEAATIIQVRSSLSLLNQMNIS